MRNYETFQAAFVLPQKNRSKEEEKKVLQTSKLAERPIEWDGWKELYLFLIILCRLLIPNNSICNMSVYVLYGWSVHEPSHTINYAKDPRPNY